MKLTIKILKGSEIKIVDQETSLDINGWYDYPVAVYDGLAIFQRGRPDFQTHFYESDHYYDQALFIQGRSAPNRNDSIYFQTESTMIDVINKLFYCFDTVKVICKTHRIMLKGV